MTHLLYSLYLYFILYIYGIYINNIILKPATNFDQPTNIQTKF